MGYLHDSLRIPENRIGVKVSSGVEPETELLLSATFPFCENICMESIGLASDVAQEFEVYLIMGRSLG